MRLQRSCASARAPSTTGSNTASWQHAVARTAAGACPTHLRLRLLAASACSTRTTSSLNPGLHLQEEQYEGTVPTLADRAMQTLYLLALDPVVEVLADPNSYGFRVGRSPADAIAQCCTVLSNRFAPDGFWKATCAPVSTVSA